MLLQFLNYDIVSVKGFSAIGNMLDNKSRMSGFKFHEIEDNEEYNIPLKQFSDLNHPARPRWSLDEDATFLKGAGIRL